jgi:membrane-associated phospholipid phosphatase
MKVSAAIFTVKILLLSLLLCGSKSLYAQNDGKPRNFYFLTRVPKDIIEVQKHTFSKSNFTKLVITTSVTSGLLLFDKIIYDDVRKFANKIHLQPAERNKIIWSIKSGGKETVLLKVPENLNTAFYNLGQGFTTLLIASGFYLQGKISKNYRSLQTASDLAESFVTLGLITQVMKYSTGRQNPSQVTTGYGTWRPFPSLSKFQHEKQNYDAFPSGHLSTLMATITILSNNYPEKKWIRPVGYVITALAGFAMVNNGVHWAGDYPVALGLGYLTGNLITKRHLGKTQIQLEKTKMNF